MESSYRGFVSLGRTNVTLLLDILIVDANWDLNVYGDTASNGGGSLCGPVDEACCSSSANGSYASKEQCRGSATLDVVETADFNEFAGKHESI